MICTSSVNCSLSQQFSILIVIIVPGNVLSKQLRVIHYDMISMTNVESILKWHPTFPVLYDIRQFHFRLTTSMSCFCMASVRCILGWHLTSMMINNTKSLCMDADISQIHFNDICWDHVSLIIHNFPFEFYNPCEFLWKLMIKINDNSYLYDTYTWYTLL